MEKIIKLLCVVILVIFLTTIICEQAYAADVSIGGMKGETSKVNSSISEIDNKSQNIVKVVSTVGAISSVVILIVLGIKYLFGSVEEKAAYKKTLLQYVIGATVLFAASTIASIIYNLAIKL